MKNWTINLQNLSGNVLITIEKIQKSLLSVYHQHLIGTIILKRPSSTMGCLWRLVIKYVWWRKKISTFVLKSLGWCWRGRNRNGQRKLGRFDLLCHYLNVDCNEVEKWSFDIFLAHNAQYNYSFLTIQKILNTFSNIK